MLRRVFVDMIFANLLALFMVGLLVGGCSMQQNPAERPDWSLTGTDRATSARTASTAKHYGD